MPAPLRLAVIGAAHSHVRYALDEVPLRADLALVGVADPDPATAGRYAGEFGVPAYDDHRRLLDELRPEVVMIAGIYADRAEALDSLSAGREPETSTAAGFVATRVALLAQQSADAGGVVLPWTDRQRGQAG